MRRAAAGCAFARLTLAGMLAIVALAPQGVAAALVSELFGKPLTGEDGSDAGRIDDFIVDVTTQRVLYLVVDGPGRYRTFSIRALGEDLRLDLSQGGNSPDLSGQTRYRRAADLVGRPLARQYPGRLWQVGTLTDLDFDPGSGRIERVIVSTQAGERSFGPEILVPPRIVPNFEAPRIDGGHTDAARGFLSSPSDAAAGHLRR